MFSRGPTTELRPGAHVRGGYRDDGGRGVVNCTDHRIYHIEEECQCLAELST
jgi:hypothetical protein